MARVTGDAPAASVVVVGPRTAEVDNLLATRRERDQDKLDEMRGGVYHMVPAPSGLHATTDAELVAVLLPLARKAELRPSTICNIGRPNDYRVPDQAFFDPKIPPQTYHPTATVIVEVVSPYDDSEAKLPFYFEVGVVEALLVDPTARRVQWYVRGEGAFVPAERSEILGISAKELAAELGWQS